MINNLFQNIIDEVTGQEPICSDEFFTTGFESIDNILTGFQSGKFVVIGGRPGMGGTTLALNMFLREAVNQIPTAYFSLDTTEREIAKKLISIAGNIPFSNFKQKTYSRRAQDKIINRILELKDIPSFVECNPQFNIDTLVNRIKVQVSSHATKIIYVDNLQLLAYNDANQDHDRYGKVCIQLKKLALELNIVIVVLSGLNRQVEYREGYEAKIPQISDLYGSSKIEGLADIILMVFRPAYYNVYYDMEGNEVRNDFCIHVVKHKNGPLGTIKLIFTKETFSLT